MSAEQLFSIVNAAVLPFWALLLFAPRWVWTQRLVHSAVVPALLGVVYTLIMFSGTPPEADPASGLEFGSLPWLMAAFTNPMAVVGGWVHYLIFDLFVGAWEVRDAERRGINHWFVVPCALLTFMLGPAGLLSYLLLRFGLQRTFSLAESS
jgi:hypothetical protein